MPPGSIHRLQNTLGRRRPRPSVAIPTGSERVAAEQAIDAYLDPRIHQVPAHLGTLLRPATAGLQGAPFNRPKILAALVRHEVHLRLAMDRAGHPLTPDEQRGFARLQELKAVVQSRFDDPSSAP